MSVLLGTAVASHLKSIHVAQLLPAACQLQALTFFHSHGVRSILDMLCLIYVCCVVQLMRHYKNTNELK